jgi:hypothetical protein
MRDLFKIASTDEDLATILSFVQVEYGLLELQGHWDGFCAASDNFGVSFKNKRDVANNFGAALVEFFELEICEFQPVS